MRKRVFGSIFITAFLAVALTVSMMLIAFYTGLSEDVRARLRDECAAIEQLAGQEGGAEQTFIGIGQSYADRLTVISATGEVLYDNRTDASQMENHLSRPEIQQALKTGEGEGDRLSETLSTRTYYAARLLPDGSVLRLSATAESSFGALSAVSPLIVLVFLLTLLAAALLASWLTGVFLAPIETLDLSDPTKNKAYDELSPLLQRLARQNRRIETQMNELKRRQAEFDDITARMDEGLILFSAEGEVVFQNRAARALFPAEAAHGGYPALCRDPAYLHAVAEALGGGSDHGRMERNGRIYELASNSTPDEGDGHAAVLFLVDVTEREQAEQQRREFSANVSHELKTPLTSIMGYAELVETGMARPGDVSRFAGKIHTEAARLLGLIEDILRLSRLDEGGMQSQFEPVELRGLCESVRGRLAEKAEKNGVSITVAGEAVTVSGVRQTLEQMAFNLCDNAIAYNKPGGSVTMTTGDENGAPYLCVSDTGIGIAPADQARVFERFYRVDKSRSKQTGGTGLGLSIVKHGAGLHGAAVTLKSEEGKGTEIRIVFPIQRN